MKQALAVTTIGIVLMSLMCACTIRSDKKISEATLEERKAQFEAYLEDTYPEEDFTVKVWQEYSEKTGSAGLPDYEGYLIRSVVIDSSGNCFMVYPGDNGKCTDDYQKVLDGWIHYNEKGQYVVYDDDGNIISEYY